MNKKYFITYGDKNYRTSLERIRQEATQLQLFDEIILYSDESLPEPFKEYTRQYKRGGGYWMWKPYIIHQTLQKMEEGDILVYTDAGCTLLPHQDWKKYFNLLQNKDAIFFLAEGKNKKWCKQDVFRFFTPQCDIWKYGNQIQATAMMIKKKGNNEVIARWYETALRHPELFTDVANDARSKEANAFREHRHDQSVLTACLCISPLSRYCILPEKLEKRYKDGQAILASRISVQNVRGIQVTTLPEKRWISYFNLYIFKRMQCIWTKSLFKFTRHCHNRLS